MGTEQQIEPGRLYLFGLTFPSALNESSPVRLIPRVSRWHTADASSQSQNPRSVRRHIGLAVSVDAVQNTAVILLGTAQPRCAHRYLPWVGTPGLPNQPPAVIEPTPREVFARFQGYLNFTHAIRVRILKLNETPDLGIPGHSYFRDYLYGGNGSSDPVLQIFVSVATEEIEKIRQYHLDYWNGLRYGEEGQGDHQDDDDSDITKRLSKNVMKLHTSLNLDPVVSGDPKDDPVDPVSGEKSSVLMAQILLEEDLRATQIEMMEPLQSTLYDLPTPQVDCVFAPLTHNALDMFSQLEFEVDC